MKGGRLLRYIALIYNFHSDANSTESIQATYLINPDGNIIAKNLRGERLAAKLKEIFG